jgi:hypothetical protein
MNSSWLGIVLGPFLNVLYESENFLVDFSRKSVLSGGIIL